MMPNNSGFEAAKGLIKEHRENTVAFFKDVLDVSTLEYYQERVIKAFDEADRLAISACHDVGKTFLAARLAMAFLSTRPNSKVITTAPTYNQVERILWSELRAAHGKAKFPLGGKLNLTDWTFSPEWFAIGFTPKNEVSGESGQGTQSSFQGFHASDLLVIFDEATGIPHNIWTMAEGLLTSARVKFVAIGNPTSKNSEFYRCFSNPSWKKIYLNCFDSPNLIANGFTNKDALQKEIESTAAMNDDEFQARLKSYKVVKPYLLTAKWVVENVRKWGLDHPLTVSKIFGEFPEGGENTLIPLGFIERAQMRKYTPVSTDRKIIGVDVARYGTDSTVLTGLHGKQQVGLDVLFRSSALEVTGAVINMSREIGGADIICVDETGVGGGVVDLLIDAVQTGALPKTCEIRGVQFGAGCEDEQDKERYANLKARMFGLLAQDLKAEDGLCLFNDSAYTEELPTILFKYDQKGRLVIESKDDYKKRTGRKSPDRSDSVALANFGRYDILNVGQFSSDFLSSTTPMSGGLSLNKGW